MLHGLALGYVLLYALLALIQRNLAAPGAYVAVVGVGHLARTVHYAAHYAYLQPLHASRGLLDARYGGTQVVQCAAASGAAYVLRLRRAQACRLEYAEGCSRYVAGRERAADDRSRVRFQILPVRGKGVCIFGRAVDGNGNAAFAEVVRIRVDLQAARLDAVAFVGDAVGKPREGCAEQELNAHD